MSDLVYLGINAKKPGRTFRLLHLILLNKVLEGFSVRIADRDEMRADLDFTFMDGIYGLQGNDV